MISKGLCDTEDWCNDAMNSALNNKNKSDFKIYLDIKWLFQIIFYNINVFTVFIK